MGSTVRITPSLPSEWRRGPAWRDGAARRRRRGGRFIAHQRARIDTDAGTPPHPIPLPRWGRGCRQALGSTAGPAVLLGGAPKSSGIRHEIFRRFEKAQESARPTLSGGPPGRAREPRSGGADFSPQRRCSAEIFRKPATTIADGRFCGVNAALRGLHPNAPSGQPVVGLPRLQSVSICVHSLSLLSFVATRPPIPIPVLLSRLQAGAPKNSCLSVYICG